MPNAVEIPASERASVQSLADSGDRSAKDMLDALPPVTPPAPAAPTDNPSDAKPTTEPPKPAGPGGVDAARDRNRDHKPTKLDDIRSLRRDRRELRESLEAERRKNQEFERRFSELEAKLKGGHAAPAGGHEDPKEDDLTRLLTKPTDYLTAREKNLRADIEKLIDEKLGNVPRLIDKMNSVKLEQSRAIEILKTTKDFDLEAFDRGEYDDEIYGLLEEQYGIDEDTADDFFKTRRAWMCGLVKKAWETRTAIEPSKRADKAAAGSGPAAGGTPRSGSPAVSLEELNRQFFAAKTPEEQEKIMLQIENWNAVPR